MGKQSSKDLFEWYAQVAETKLKKLKEKYNIDIFLDCKDKEVFSNYMLLVFIQYYGLRCTCDDCMDWDFNIARSHYHHCQLYQFSYLVQRCLDWAEKQKEVKAGCNADSHDDGIPPNTKELGILPTIL